MMIMMEKIIIWVFIASLSGSLMYFLRKVFLPLWNKQEQTATSYVVLHLTAVVYLFVLIIGMIYVNWIIQVPHAVSWGETPNGIRMVLTILSGVWLAGAVIGVYRYVQVYRVHRKLLQNSVFAPNEAQLLAAEAAQMAGVRQKVSVYYNDGLYTAELGVGFTPKIYMPHIEYTEEQIRIIIFHELIHYHYGDHLMRLLTALIEAIHWFNPIVRKSNMDLIHWDELHCDDCVCEKIEDSCSEYAKTLYYMCEYYIKHKNNVKSSDLKWIGFGGEGKMEERVRRILQFHHHDSKCKVLLVSMYAVLFLSVGGMTALAAEVGAECAYAKLTERYEMTDEVEGAVATEKLQIYYDIPDVLIETDETTLPQASSSGIIDVTVAGNTCLEMGYFHATEGDIVSLLVSCDPSNIPLSVGLKKSDATAQYVYSGGNITCSFEVTSTGYYTVYFQNDTSTKVSVTGYYLTLSDS